MKAPPTKIKTARYFKVNFRYSQAFVLGIKGDNTASFKEITAIKTEYESYGNSAMFPLKYKYEGKNFVIKYDDFASTLCEYYAATAELAGNLKKIDLQYEYAQKTYNFPTVSYYFKYLACSYIIDYWNEKKTYNSEMAKFALEQIRAYNKLSEDERTTVENSNFPTPLSSSRNILKVLNSEPNFDNSASICGEAAVALMARDKRDDAVCLQLFEAAVLGDKNVSDALSYSKSRLKSESIVLGKSMTSADFDARNKKLGIGIIDKLSSKVTDTNCEDLKKFADDYTTFGEAQKAQSFNTRSMKCLENRKKEEERRIAQQKKDEERRERERRRANREFSCICWRECISHCSLNQWTWVVY